MERKSFPWFHSTELAYAQLTAFSFNHFFFSKANICQKNELHSSTKVCLIVKFDLCSTWKWTSACIICTALQHPLDGMIGSLMPTATELDDPFRLVAELLKGFLASIIHQKCKSRQAHSSGRINTGKTIFWKKRKRSFVRNFPPQTQNCTDKCFCQRIEWMLS